MRIVAQMMIRNEVDIIEETLSEIVRWGIDEIVVLDAASTDGTVEAVTSFLRADIDFRTSPDPMGRFEDYRRNELLRMTRRHNPDWIISVDADEIYHTDPKTAIMIADDVGCNVIRNVIPQFWITVADVLDGLIVEDQRLSVQKRRRWYSWGHMGTFIWKENPDHFYPRNISKRTPELPGMTWREWQKASIINPVCKHYTFRSLDQSVKRARERRERGGRKYFGKYFLNWIVDEEVCKLDYFDGKQWNTFPNHDLVCEYMGLKKRRKQRVRKESE